MDDFIGIKTLRNDPEFTNVFRKLYFDFKKNTKNGLAEQVRLKTKFNSENSSVEEKISILDAYYDLKKKLFLKRVDFHTKLLQAGKECAAKKGIVLDYRVSNTLDLSPQIPWTDRHYTDEVARLKGEHILAQKGVKQWIASANNGRFFPFFLYKSGHPDVR